MTNDIAIVTGAAGFVGSHIVDRLLGQGYRVVGIDDLSRGTEHNLSDALRSSSFSFFKLDVSDTKLALQTLREALQPGSVKLVWHMAANSDIAAGVADPTIDLNATFMTTFSVIEIARSLAIRQLVFASSSAVYGDRRGRLTEETGPLLPISNYGAMKLASEGIISAAAESFLERAWIFRFPNVVGKRLTHGVIYDFMAKLHNSPERLHILGDGSQRKEYLHVDDLLDAMFLAVEGATEKLACFNIGTGDDGATVRFIADAVCSAMSPSAQKVYGTGQKGWVGDVPRFNYSIDKIQRLGWCPRMTSEQAIIRSINELLAK